MDWFRSWHGAPTDNKWLLIAKRAGVTPMMVSAVFWALLDYASQQEERGSIAGFDVETYSLWAGVEESDILNVLDAMRAKGIITDGDTLAAWDKRQPKREDGSAERVRRHRDKQQKIVSLDHVTQCNAHETQCNAPDKIRLDPDTETDTELSPNGVAHAAQISILPAQMTPTSPQKPKRPRTENQQQQDAWVEAFAYALEFDAKIPGNYARWAKIGKGYAAAGYTPDDIRTWKDFRWPADWRCDKGQRPTKQALDDGISDIKRRREAATRPKQLRNIIDSAGNIVGQVEVAV